MNIKSAIISAVLTISALTASMTVSAEPKETTNIPTGSAEVTKEVTTTTDTTTTSASTTQHTPTAGSIVIDSDKVETGEFFDEVMQYVGKDNAANLNDNLKNNALAINSTTIDYSDKSMFTITTRSGDVFYLIINNSDGTCLFLNTVDTADLTSLLNKNNGGGTKTLNDQAINDIEQTEKEQEVITSKAYTSAMSEDTSVSQSNAESKNISWAKNLMWIGIALVGSAVIALIAFVIKSKRRNGSSSYDKDFEDITVDNSLSFNEDDTAYMEDDEK